MRQPHHRSCHVRRTFFAGSLHFFDLLPKPVVYLKVLALLLNRLPPAQLKHFEHVTYPVASQKRQSRSTRTCPRPLQSRHHVSRPNIPLLLHVQQPRQRETEPRSCLPQLRAGHDRTRVLWQVAQYGMFGLRYCVVRIVNLGDGKKGPRDPADGVALTM